MQTGSVFKIQKYSIHDGPGIRTAVFFKGCPLACWWCHNPESKKFVEEMIFHKNKCTACRRCMYVCRNNAIHFDSEGLVRNNELCNSCYSCVPFCPSSALEVIGRKKTVEEIVKAIKKDVAFYDESNGGVTFTGGEPLAQVEFLYEVLKCCKNEGIHTAVDTCGYVPWEAFEAIYGYVDLFLYDVKYIDENKHRMYTGVSNKLILSNLVNLSEIHQNINIRIPIIPGVNDDIENIEAEIQYFRSLNMSNEKNINLLPYHNMGRHKYEKLGLEYKLGGVVAPSDNEMQSIAEVLRGKGLSVKIGG